MIWKNDKLEGEKTRKKEGGGGGGERERAKKSGKVGREGEG